MSNFVEPNTVIRILKNVPLDITYDHTLYWTGANDAAKRNAQLTYFTGKTKTDSLVGAYLFDNQSYQRVNNGVIRLGINAVNLYDCNYLMFQNSRFGNSRWFYAFIESVEYENEDMCLVSYIIDVMQTWYFDYELERCFVEREHSDHDTLFYNIVPENLDLGNEYEVNSLTEYDMSEMNLCILINRIVPGQSLQTHSQIINHVFTPINIADGIEVKEENIPRIDLFLDAFQEDDIICIYQYPKVLKSYQEQEEHYGEQIIYPNVSSIDGYTPRNKKLFSYPYNYLLVSNNCGQTANYKWEEFTLRTTPAISTPHTVFRINGASISTPAMLCYPRNYRKIPDDFEDGLVYSDFPQCAWAGDTFKAWWAQNKASWGAGVLSTVLSSVGSGLSAGLMSTLATANPAVGLVSGIASTAVSALPGIAQSVAKIQDIKNTPSQTHGKVQADSLNAALDRIKYSFYSLSIKSYAAQIIDDFFDRYGYATKRNKIPNTYVRENWTYTKTIGCTIVASIPAQDAKKICDIYNNGITFWANPNSVGHYEYTNRPLLDIQGG